MNFYLPLPPFGPRGREPLVSVNDFITSEDIDYILSRPEWKDLQEAAVLSGGVPTLNTEIRSSSTCWMKYDPDNAILWTKFLDMVWRVNQQYFQFDLSGFIEPGQLSIYTSNNKSHFGWHTDFSIEHSYVPRKLSICILLNDPSEFEGGELQTMVNSDKVQTLEQAKGRAWAFPSWTLHQVTPVTKGVRKSLVLWVCGPGFK